MACGVFACLFLTFGLGPHLKVLMAYSWLIAPGLFLAGLRYTAGSRTKISSVEGKFVLSLYSFSFSLILGSLCSPT